MDTETAGTPLNNTASYRNIDNWPTIQQIAWIVYKKDGEKVSSNNYAIGWNSSSNITASGYVQKVVLPIHRILDCFLNDLSKCSVIIGHNIEYDVNVILSELYRYGKDTSRLEKMQQFCTMKNSVELCGFDTSQGNRFPKLQELYSKLFHQPFENAHDAYCDIKATADCYWKIVNDGLLNIESFPFLLDSSIKNKKAKEYVDKAEQLLSQQRVVRQQSIRSLEDAISERKVLMTFLSLNCDFNERKYLKYIKEKNNLIGYNLKEVKKWEEDKLKQEQEEKRKEEEAIIRSYDEPISLLKKASELGDSKSLYRIGNIYRYELSDDNTAYEWYIKARDEGCYDLDFYFDLANLSTRIYGSKSVNGPEYYKRWADMCESWFNTIPRKHLELYIEACEKGRYGQKQDIQKAIDIYQRALALNRPEFGRTIRNGYCYHGIRYEYASLLEKINDYAGAEKQYKAYLEEVKSKEIDPSSDIYNIWERERSFHIYQINNKIDELKKKKQSS